MHWRPPGLSGLFPSASAHGWQSTCRYAGASAAWTRTAMHGEHIAPGPEAFSPPAAGKNARLSRRKQRRSAIGRRKMNGVGDEQVTHSSHSQALRFSLGHRVGGHVRHAAPPPAEY